MSRMPWRIAEDRKKKKRDTVVQGVQGVKFDDQK